MNKALLILLFIPFVYADPVIDWKGKKYRIIRNYLKVQKKYFKRLCRDGEQVYNEFNKKFRGTGFFVPHLDYRELDQEAIDNNIMLLQKKMQWIKREQEKLKRKKKLDVEKEKYKKLMQYFVQVVDIKQRFYESNENRENILSEGDKKVQLLHQRTKELLDGASFIKPFGYPVDHFAMRKEHDYYKFHTSIEGQRKKNDLRFKRKIFEDGAQNPDHTKSDSFFRALINSIEIQFQAQNAIIDENFRYDFISFLIRMGRYLQVSKKNHLERLEEWRDRTQRTLNFYLDISQQSRKEYTKSILQGMSEAKHELITFNFEKQRSVYDFWLKQSELNRALFVLETILINEVSDLDGRDALERKDVAQVVINRTQTPFYRSIDENDAISPYIKSIGKRRLAQSKWLNVMFKEGEFSFTYFFIPASKKIYCPDMSRRGRFIRKENLSIALEILKNPNSQFKAIRYFSRASMLGRINMAKIWIGFTALPQRVGNKSMKNSLLQRLYQRGKYRFLYEFHDAEGRRFQVLEIKRRGAMGGKAYAYAPIEKIFFNYRNPHYFTYFAQH